MLDLTDCADRKTGMYSWLEAAARHREPSEGPMFDFVQPFVGTVDELRRRGRDAVHSVKAERDLLADSSEGRQDAGCHPSARIPVVEATRRARRDHGREGVHADRADLNLRALDSAALSDRSVISRTALRLGNGLRSTRGTL